jgi:hypothetical protein
MSPARLSLAAVLALGMGGAASAQGVPPNDPQAQAQFQQQTQAYQDQPSQYQAGPQAYRDHHDSEHPPSEGRGARDHYDANLEEYEAQRDAFDAKYGPGAWVSRYGYHYNRSSRDHR